MAAAFGKRYYHMVRVSAAAAAVVVVVVVVVVVDMDFSLVVQIHFFGTSQIYHASTLDFHRIY